MYTPGDFSFIDGREERAMLEDAYKAVSSTQSWDLLKNRDESESKQMRQAMKYPRHTCTSYASTMHHMKRIAVIGWDNYILEYLCAL